MAIRIAFTTDELVELRRALDLIGQEDANADVNMQPDAVAAKNSAMKKIERAIGPRRDPSKAATHSVDVFTGEVRKIK